VPAVINLDASFAALREYFNPRVVAEVNDVVVKATKLKGEFIWHHHEHEDELFLVMRGELRICFRDGDRILKEGEFIVVPRGVEHKPVAESEVHVLLVEPKATLNTGNVRNELTRPLDQHL
jgi:mannose-6-phosphate isomerase-like protein (cupin superfamily)